MTRIAYIWVLASVGFAIWFHSHEEDQRAEAIEKATAHALYVGIKAGCDANNQIREQVRITATALHPVSRDLVQDSLADQNCHRDAHKVVVLYLSRSRP